MRILLLADVHANWQALLSLQRAERKPDAVLFAGDAVGYGPDASDCARWLLANTTAAVRGNHDDGAQRSQRDGVCFGVPPELVSAAREMIAYSHQCLSARELNGIGHWPLTASLALGGARFYIAHGTPADPLCGQLNPALCPEADLHSLFDGIEADVIVVGHTHMPAIRKFAGRLIVNPGSLGQPRYGTPDATYAVWEDGQLQIKHLHYDHDTTAQRLRLAPVSIETIEQLTAVLEKGFLQ